jgi:hypothetical protein
MEPGKKLLNISLCLTTASILLPGVSYAGCSRDDIDHYLSKGFTPGQITALCTQDPAASDKKPAAEVSSQKNKQAVPANTVKTQENTSQSKPAESATPAATSAAGTSAAGPAYESNEQFLKTAIEGYDVVLGENKLSYVHKTCVKSGEEDLFGFIPMTCPDVKYTVSLMGLDVKSVKKRYTFYGPMVARVKGNIQREIIANFNPENDDVRKLVMDQIDTGPMTDIPIREGIPAAQVKKVFSEIIK